MMHWIHFIYRLPAFALFYSKEVILASFRVTWEILRSRYSMKPGIVAVPLDVKRELEILLLVNVITMTPGMLSLDLSMDRRCLYVHAIFVEDPEELVNYIKNDIEKRITKLFS